MVSKVLVLGGGSAGLIAAITLKRAMPDLRVRVVRSKEIGVIGVGEGTTSYFRTHLFKHLALHPKKFYEEAQPTWKLGIRFLWGKDRDFFYPFTSELDTRKLPDGIGRSPGFYASEDTRYFGISTACMCHGRAFPRRADGLPDLSVGHAYHIENEKLVSWLEGTARSLKVEVVDGTVASVERDGTRIAALVLEDGSREEANLFVDASGFRSMLLQKELEEPWVDYSSSLFCDRAIIGGWERGDEEILPYTTAEAMDAGWCWQIEHEKWINRGYVYSSRFVSDDAALEEMMRKNPKISSEPRRVGFRSGRARNSWVGNVVAIGNSSGFVEPLEATALHNICSQSRRLGSILMDSNRQPTEVMIDLHNRANAKAWDDIRDFLVVHYAFNEWQDTPFWKACREQSDLGGAGEIVRFYRESGPASFAGGPLIDRGNSFGLEGYWSMLVGQRVPHQREHPASAKEEAAWARFQQKLANSAKSGLTVAESLAMIRNPKWKWL